MKPYPPPILDHHRKRFRYRDSIIVPNIAVANTAYNIEDQLVLPTVDKSNPLVVRRAIVLLVDKSEMPPPTLKEHFLILILQCVVS